MPKVKKESPNLQEENIEKLRQIFPEIVSDGKIDLERLRVIIGEGIDSQPERFSFSWSGKRDSIHISLLPTKATLVPVRRESVKFDDTKNLFIEGDNLEVMKTLYKAYYGKIKMIYIDPPYNTGNDFVYPDSYTDPLQAYLKITGQIGEKGNLLTSNPETSGRYHSSWLSMVYPRLSLAKQLLSDDGLIFVSIDDHEIHHLRQIMDEIFGEENFVATFVWRRRASSALAEKLVSVDHEYVLVYQRGNFGEFLGQRKDYANYKNPDHDPRGPWTLADLTVGMTKEQRPNQYYDLVDPQTRKSYPANSNRVWGFIPESMSKLIETGRVVFPTDPSRRPMLKRYKTDLKSEVNPISTWVRGRTEEGSDEVLELETGLNAEGTRMMQELFGETIFNYSKPVSLVTSLARYCTSGNDIILDPFAGSCTTAQAVLELNHEDGGNRSFVCIQLPEPIEGKKLRDGTVLRTISDIGKERIRRVIKELENEQRQKKLDSNQSPALGFRVFKLSTSNCFVWDDEEAGNLGSLVKHIEEAAKGASKASEDALAYEIMLREGFTLDTTIEQVKVGKNFFLRVSNGQATMWMCFDEHINDVSIGKLSVAKDDKFVVLDSSLTDTQKVNLARKLRVETV